MRIFLTGVSCVGKTTIGNKMAKLLGVNFFDLDEEIENFFNTSIERLQHKFLTICSFRNEAAKALLDLLNRPESKRCVVALPPSGLMGGYLRVVKKVGCTTVVLTDKPENILDRISFYDLDSRLIEKKLTPKEKKLYLKEIKKDITYFGKSYHRANLQVDISGFDAEHAASKVIEVIKKFDNTIISDT
ncbi:shikimate kinase [Desulfogranum japonicum]|uniref:shikimate kinase n=1 Tax=Desulfogranum japonicum TaxID=231447 RepID=UPI000424A87D|nr:shikimate kinase [Desulfogranum japonicum]